MGQTFSYIRSLYQMEQSPHQPLSNQQSEESQLKQPKLVPHQGFKSNKFRLKEDVIKECAEHNIFIQQDEDIRGLLWVVVYLSCGRLAGLPVCLKIFMKDTYPLDPPIVHLLTKTALENYHFYDSRLYIDITAPHAASNSCIDMLYPTTNSFSKWNPSITLQGMILSFVAGLTTYYMPQVATMDIYTYQSISVEKLNYIRKDAVETYNNYKDKLPSLKPIKHEEGYSINTCPIIFSDSELISGPHAVFPSDGFLLNGRYSVRLNMPEVIPANTVITFIITNNPDDIKSEKPETRSVQCGITGVMATKTENDKQKWSMFGTPFIDATQICITIDPDQFTVATKSTIWIINGGMPVCNPTKLFGKICDTIWYLAIVFNSKNGPTCEIQIDTEAVSGVIYKRDPNDEIPLYLVPENSRLNTKVKLKENKYNMIKNRLEKYCELFYLEITATLSNFGYSNYTIPLIKFNDYKDSSRVAIDLYKEKMQEIRNLLYKLGLTYKFEINDNKNIITFLNCQAKIIESNKCEFYLDTDGILIFKFNNSTNIKNTNEDKIVTVNIIIHFGNLISFTKKLKTINL